MAGIVGSYYQNQNSGEVLERQVLNDRLNLDKHQEVPDPWKRVRIEPFATGGSASPIDTLLMDIPKPSGIRVSVEFIGEDRKYGIWLPAIDASQENAAALEDAITELAGTAVRLHIATHKGV